MSRLLRNRRTGPLPTATTPAGEVLTFHQQLPGYRPTAVVELPAVASRAGVGRLLVKAETERFGLPAFKALGASWATHRLLSERAADAPPPKRLVAATDGNHGRAVAWMARSLGLDATILVPAGTASARIAAIESEGAAVEVVDGTYDDAVAASAALASPTALVVSDTSWPGYEDVPRWVIEGYSTVFAELDAQVDWGEVDVVVVPLGVGAFGAAAAAHLAGRVLLVGVEPDTAACCLAAVAAGHVVEVPGPHESIMAGLNCGLASMLALPVLASGFDAFVTISDDRCAEVMVAMADAGLDVGECGAAGVAALVEVTTSYRGELPIDEGTTALVVATEGVTDPASFERFVGRPPSC